MILFEPEAIYLKLGTMNTLLTLVLISLLFIAGALIYGRRKNRHKTVINKITLQDLSALWTKKGAKNIHISELSPIWRDNEIAAEQNTPLQELQSTRAREFMEKYIHHGPWFQKAMPQKAVCCSILELLDREGNCPSVVNISSDVEGKWDDNTYRLLSQTTLLDHTLNVAEQVIELLTEADARHVLPDTLVAALGHDLGKLESMRGYLYSLGEHPLTAGRPLAEIPGFNELSRKEEILRAIKLHHKKPEGLLGKILKKADQRARQKELEENVILLTSSEKPKMAKPVASPSSAKLAVKVEERVPVSSMPPAPPGNNTTAARQAQADIYEVDAPDSQQKESEVPKLMDISSWFDAEDFLQKLKPYINKMFGRRFMAFSMPDGHVYFQTKVLEEVARKQAEQSGNMEIATMANGDLTMRQVLLTIVHHLRSDHDVIARGLIKDNFFGGYFTVERKSSKNMKGYYTPFHAEAFGSIAEMENSKPEALKELQKVTPYLSENTT